MGVRRPAFALILVLLLVGAVFAMSVHSAVVLRAAISETSAVGAAQADLRTAHSAASVVLRSLRASGGPSTGDGEGSGGSDGAAGAEDRLDLPPIVRQLLEAAGVDIDEETQDDGGEAITGGGTGDAADAEQAEFERGIVQLPSEPVVMRMDNRRVTVRLRDATGSLNVNRVSEASLRAYLRLKGLDGTSLEAVSDQILDWRDEDGVPRSRGFEAGGYRRIGIEPRNGPLATLEELRLLPAVTDEVFALIRADLCLTGDGRVHLGSASSEVLRAVGGLSESQASDIIRAREVGLLTEDNLDRVLGRQRGEFLVRIESSSLIRLRVEVARDEGSIRVFEGLAVFTGRSISSFGLRESIPDRFVAGGMMETLQVERAEIGQ